MVSNQIDFDDWRTPGNSTDNEAFDGALSVIKPMVWTVLFMVFGCILGIIIIAFSKTTSSGVDGTDTKPKPTPANSQSTGVGAAFQIQAKDFRP